MSGPGGQPAGREPRYAVGALIRAGHGDEAIAAADRLLAELTDDHAVVGVLLSKLAALLNLNRLSQCTQVVDEIWARLGPADADTAQAGEFHSLAGDLAYRRGSVEQCVSHLVRGARALEGTAPGRASMRAWVSAATAYSYIGFHRQAMAALARAQDLSRIGTAEERMVALQPEIATRYAAALDQQGESVRACEVLGGITERLRPQDVTPMERPYLGYAIARRALLRGLPGAAEPSASEPDPANVARAVRELLGAVSDSDPESRELRKLGEVMLTVVEGRPAEALALLDEAETTYTRLGPAEVPRLKTFVHVALGAYDAAFAAQCEVTASLSRNGSRLYDLFVDGVTTRIDYDELLRNAGRYADQARTDALTGLPNRRHLEQYFTDLRVRGEYGAILVADVDRFKDVNTVHGHLVGDQVLQRIAAVLTRTLRRGEFAARFGGDEFVVVMPECDPAVAEQIAQRLTAAVASHPWDAMAPGTPISLTVGLARFSPGESLLDALHAADLRMLSAKRTSAY